MEKEAKNFEDANSACTDKGGFLVEPRSAELTTALATFTWGELAVWSGLRRFNKTSQFTWSTDNEPLTYTNWEGGQPSQSVIFKGPANCMTILRRHKWINKDCTWTFHYICQANKRELFC